MALWEDLFTGSPKGVNLGAPFNAYANTAGALNKLRSQKIANALSQIKLNYAPQMAQQGADLGAANVSIKQNEAKYAPQMSQAELGFKNAQIVHEHAATVAENLMSQGRRIDNAMKSREFDAQPQKIQNDLALQKAKIQAALAHVTSVANTAQAEQRRNGALYQVQQMVKNVPAAERPAWLAAHPQYEAILNSNLNTAASSLPSMQQPQAQQQGAPQPQAAPFNPLGNMGSPQQQSDNAPPGMIAAPQNQASANAPVPPQQPSALENQSKFLANSKAAGTKATQRLNSAIELEKIMSDPDFDALAKNASKYAGIKGKIKGGMDAWFNTNPKEYNDYLQFKNQYASMITNVMRQVEGLGVQESTREEIRGNLMQALDQLSSNPERAMEQYNRTKSQLRKLASAASVAAQPTFPGAREKAAGISFEDEPKDEIDLASLNQQNNDVRLIDKSGNEYDVPASRADEAIKQYGLKRKG